MFAVLHSDINSPKSSLLHLTSQPYWKKNRSAKVKDGIINFFLRNNLIGRYRGITKAWNTKRGSISVLLTSCLTRLDMSVLQIKTKIVSCHTADSKPAKQEVNGTVTLPPLVFAG